MTEVEINEQIAEINDALSAIRKGGQSYTINSGSSTREVTQADYNSLVAEKNQLYRKLKEVQGDSGFNLRAGW